MDGVPVSVDYDRELPGYGCCDQTIQRRFRNSTDGGGRVGSEQLSLGSAEEFTCLDWRAAVLGPQLDGNRAGSYWFRGDGEQTLQTITMK